MSEAPKAAHADPAAKPAGKPAGKKGGKSDGKPKPKKGGGKVDIKSIPLPDFWQERIAAFEKLYEIQCNENALKEKPITVKLLNGKEIPGTAFKTTPIDIAKTISNSMADKMFGAKVNDVMWDLNRPLEDDCTVDLIDWESAEGRKIFWHSSAHILGAAMEWKYGAKLSTGPPLEEGGFFYEADTKEPVSEADYQAVDALIKDVTSKKHPFQRLVIKKEDALELFKYNSFKHATLKDKVPEGGTCTIYRCGPLIDPCRGPHLPHTGRVKAMAVHKNSSSYWRNKDTNPVLQRIYGISFPQEKMLTEWKEVMAAAAQNDHRRLGVQQNLWMFHEYSPGSCFWFPNGAKIYNKLTEWIRKEYRKRGFDEVISPNMYNKKLWETSGHWAKYSEDMFRIGNDAPGTPAEKEAAEKDTYALKPMNCPGHCLMYGNTRHSYRELPIRYADFGVLHRNELAGALSGLTRVRRFCQDDAHIFCLPEQTTEEIEKGLAFIEHIYKVLGFSFHLALSTRPAENVMLGTHEMWDKSEGYLAKALNKFCNINEDLDDPMIAGEKFTFDGSEGHLRRLKMIMQSADKAGKEHGIRHTWAINPGDGAFYGPKIDIRIEDCMKRKHQLGTLQLDFNLPQRFDLTFDPPKSAEEAKKQAEATKEGEVKKVEEKVRPVMIHRAILGSLERCIAILTEHWKGKWPFWISPRQAIVVPVSEAHMEYAKKVKESLYGEGYEVAIDQSDAQLGKKIRNGQMAQYNFILVVGESEVSTETVNVRLRQSDNKSGEQVVKTIPELLEQWKGLCDTQDCSI